MNKSRDPRQQLLADTLDGDWAHGPAVALARRAAAHARRRRTVRRATGGLAVVAVLGLAALFLFRAQAPVPEAQPAPAPLAYELITEEQLLEALRERPLLIFPDKTGPEKIVVLAH